MKNFKAEKGKNRKQHLHFIILYLPSDITIENIFYFSIIPLNIEFLFCFYKITQKLFLLLTLSGNNFLFCKNQIIISIGRQIMTPNSFTENSYFTFIFTKWNLKYSLFNFSMLKFTKQNKIDFVKPNHDQTNNNMYIYFIF